MAEESAAIVFFTVFWWIPAAWVFFDAEERDYSAYLWGAVSLVFWFLGTIVYFVVRSRRAPTSVPYSRSRIYLHVGLLTFWGLTMTAIWSMLWGVLQWAGAEDGFFAEREEELRYSLAFGLATGLIAAPALVLHYILLRRRITSTVEGPVRLALARMQEGMAWLTVVISAIIAAFGGAVLVYGVVGTLFDLGSLSRDAGANAAAATLVPGFSLLLTFVLFFSDAEYRRGRDVRRRAEAAIQASPASSAPAVAPTAATPAGWGLPSARPVAPPDAPSGQAFCGACGTPRGPGARFCGQCGAGFEAAANA
ncbi:MAG: zinc ribbon domain-containing protein [Dehalococcoidia bacterium]